MSNNPDLHGLASVCPVHQRRYLSLVGVNCHRTRQADCLDRPSEDPDLRPDVAADAEATGEHFAGGEIPALVQRVLRLSCGVGSAGRPITHSSS